MKNQQSIYLDYNATTPVADEVVSAMTDALKHRYANPSSPYSDGLDAARAISAARASIGTLIGCNASELHFTGCATEANNLALLGIASTFTEPQHLIISAIEHPAIMQPAKYLESRGWQLSIIPVDQYGLVSVENLLKEVRPNTVLVSIMLANNEVGTIQPIAEIAQGLKKKDKNILLHTDAAQAVGKIPADVNKLGVDLLTLAGHKFYASKGIGALYVRQGLKINNVLHGAGHEAGLRPGTENTPAIIGMGVAADLAVYRLAQTENTLQQRTDQLNQLLLKAIPGLRLNGHPELRLPNTLNVSFPGVIGQQLLNATEGQILASVGSACHASSDKPSGVLGAMNLDNQRAAGAVRISTGWNTSEQEIEKAAEVLIKAWGELV
ncbi:cysteine desulfurase family protein [Pelagibaculum spongiae]|uniref:cysteine desulfurase n=1 Tax=Pelagibaculum spongiae TaxID=2080658 RepID=A0A2V1GU17_9GAMM|nr:cysteine desulfurase family protein [Pelagibaculum spongiae]PVZ65668.1 cysteine desulfurase NifS [Pelagibaculum spongiae]